MKEKIPTRDSAFQLDNEIDQARDGAQAFHLESTALETAAPNSIASEALQNELYLPVNNPESPDDNQQLEFNGLEKPIYAMQVEGIPEPLQFHYANNLLESLEAQDIQVHYECRDGYCGACRTDLIEGEVAYLQEPMAWINKGEILPCCCVPKTALKLKLKG